MWFIYFIKYIYIHTQISICGCICGCFLRVPEDFMDVLRRLGLLCVNVCGEKIFILAEQDHVRSTGTCSRRPSIVNNPSASLTPSTARMSAASTSCCTASSRLPRLGLVVLRLTLHPWDFRLHRDGPLAVHLSSWHGHRLPPAVRWRHCPHCLLVKFASSRHWLTVPRVLAQGPRCPALLSRCLRPAHSSRVLLITLLVHRGHPCSCQYDELQTLQHTCRHLRQAFLRRHPCIKSH